MDGVVTGLSRALMTPWGGTGGPKGGEGTASILPAPKVARGWRASCRPHGWHGDGEHPASSMGPASSWAVLRAAKFWRGCGTAGIAGRRCTGTGMGPGTRRRRSSGAERRRAEASARPHAFFIGCAQGYFYFLLFFLSPPLRSRKSPN